MKILVAGAQGQLARALLGQAQARGGMKVVALGRPQLDLLDKASIRPRHRRGAAGPRGQCRRLYGGRQGGKRC